MKPILWIIITAFFTTITLAADSSWLLCKNTLHPNPHDELTPIISVYEHRSGASNRKTEIYFIYGIHLLTGSLLNVNEGKINLKSPSCKKDDAFKGNIKVDYSANLLFLKGDYISAADGSHKLYEFELNCEVMN